LQSHGEHEVVKAVESTVLAGLSLRLHERLDVRAVLDLLRTRSRAIPR
jgi:hypothetical protein